MSHDKRPRRSHRGHFVRSQSCHLSASHLTHTARPQQVTAAAKTNRSRILGRSVSDCGQRMRSFESTKHGRVVNRGDSFRRVDRCCGQFGAATGVSLSVNGRLHDTDRGVTRSSGSGHVIGGDTTQPDTTPSHVTVRRVLVVGSVGVGKSSLIGHFQASEYCPDHGDGVTVSDFSTVSVAVTVSLDGCEAELQITELNDDSSSDWTRTEEVTDYDMLVVVYSVSDRHSFSAASALVARLAAVLVAPPPVILAANKCDLVRHRKVATKEGLQLAVQFGYKYIETSVVISANIDQLLAGITAQTQLYSQSAPSVAGRSTNQKTPSWYTQRNKPRVTPSSVVNRMLKKFMHLGETNSCQNLLTL